MNGQPATEQHVMAFVAILVTAIILISAIHADPLIVKSAADLTIAYLTWRLAVGSRAGGDKDA